MRTTVLIYFNLLISAFAFSQTYQWANNIGGSNSDQGNSITIDASGNVYVTGPFQDIADFDPGIGVVNLISGGGYDIFVAKYNSNGNYIYAFRIGSTLSDGGYSIAADNDGNAYILATFSSIADFNPGAATDNLSSSGGYDVAFAKYDPTGNYLWAKKVGGSGDDFSQGITIDSYGNCYITGYFTGTSDFDPGPGTTNLTSYGGNDIFFAKYDGNGNLLYARSIGGSSSDESYSITVDTLQNIYLTGMFKGAVDFDPGAGSASLSSTGGGNIFFAGYDINGNFIYAQSIGNTNASDNIGKSIFSDAAGNVFLTGQFNNSADFDPGPGTQNLTSSGSDDIFIAAYDVNGNYIMAIKIGGSGTDIGRSVKTDGNGKLYITGYFSGTIDFDSGPGVFNVTSNGGTDIFVAVYNTAGAFLNAFGIGSSNNDYGYSLGYYNGNLAITGSLSGTADFDPGTGNATVTTNGSGDIFVAKYTFCSMAYSMTKTDISCNGANEGTATVTPYTPPYTYLWSNGQTSQTATGLIAGTVIVTMTDPNNCMTIDSITINEPPPLLTNSIADFVGCYGGCDGSGLTNVTGGTPPYSYFWSNGSTTASATGLCAENYSVTITDYLGCTYEDSIWIFEPPQLNIDSIITTDASCPDTSCADGSATLYVSGGTGEYYYYWSNGASTSNATGLIPDTFFVMVSDSNGCTIADTIYISYDMGIAGYYWMENFSVIPNPAKDVIEIKINSPLNDSDKKKIKFYNICGMVVKENLLTGDKISVAMLAEGLYAVSLEANGSVMALRKVVIIK